MKRLIAFLLLLSWCLTSCSSGEDKKELGRVLMDMSMSEREGHDVEDYERLLEDHGIEYERQGGYGIDYSGSVVMETPCTLFGSDMLGRISYWEYTSEGLDYASVKFKSTKEMKGWLSAIKKYLNKKQLKGYFSGEIKDEQGDEALAYIIEVDDYPVSWLHPNSPNKKQQEIEDGEKAYLVAILTFKENLQLGDFPMDVDYIESGYVVSCKYVKATEFGIRYKYAKYGDSFECDLYPTDYGYFEKGGDWTLNGKKCDGNLESEVDPNDKVHVKAKKSGGEMEYKLTVK